MPLVTILLFSVLTSIPYAVAVSYESVGEVLKFTTAAAHKIDVVGDGDGCVVVKTQQWQDNIGQSIKGNVTQEKTNSMQENTRKKGEKRQKLGQSR